MPPKPFEFDLQPVLDHAQEEVRACELAFVWAREAVQEALDALTKQTELHASLVQQQQAARDNLFRADEANLARLWNDRLSALRTLVAASDRRVESHRQELVWCRLRESIRQSELDEAITRAEMLKGMRSKEEASYLKRLEEIEEKEIEESSIQSWNTRRQ